MTREALDHLLLSIGLAGSYGGATATTGTNLKTHLGGVYWGAFERSINAPQEMLHALHTLEGEPICGRGAGAGPSRAGFQSSRHWLPPHIAAEPLRQYVAQLVQAFETVIRP